MMEPWIESSTGGGLNHNKNKLLSFERQYSLPYIEMDSIQLQNNANFDEGFFNKPSSQPFDYQEFYELQLHNQAKR